MIVMFKYLMNRIFEDQHPMNHIFEEQPPMASFKGAHEYPQPLQQV